MKNLLVTGVGAIIGYGVLNSLRASNADVRLVGADIYEDAVGQEWADDFVQAPYTSDEGYSVWLASVVDQYAIDLIIPGIEQDLYYLSANRQAVQDLGVKIVLNQQSLIELAEDKWLFHNELKRIDSEARIESHIDGEFAGFADLLGLPFLLKPRRGYASKGIVIVNSEADFDLVKHKLGSELIAQAMVGSDDSEFTVGIFGDGDGAVCSAITLRRLLSVDGSTAKAWVEKHASLDAVVESLCRHFQPLGPTNLQFRRVDDGWKLLEINPRISSSTSIRTAFGYNESKMSLDYFLHGKTIVQPSLKRGSASRYIADRVTYDSDNI